MRPLQIAPVHVQQKLGLTGSVRPISLYSRTDWSVNKLVPREIRVHASRVKKCPSSWAPPDSDLQERRRAEILDAATKVFSSRGFAAADVQEIADKTGVGKGTIYRYFSSKEELFLAAVDHGMRNLKLAVDAAAASAKPPLDRIAEGVLAYLTFFDEHPEIVELLVQERANFRDRKKPTYFVHRDANMGPWQALFRELIQVGLVATSRSSGSPNSFPTWYTGRCSPTTFRVVRQRSPVNATPSWTWCFMACSSVAKLRPSNSSPEENL